MSSKNESWLIDPVTRDYVLDSNGNPTIDKTLKTPAYIRVKTPRTKWLYAPDEKYGSDLYLIKKNLTNGDNTAVINAEERALEPLIDQGRAVSIIAENVSQGRNYIQTKIEILDAQGEVDELLLAPVGG